MGDAARAGRSERIGTRTCTGRSHSRPDRRAGPRPTLRHDRYGGLAPESPMPGVPRAPKGCCTRLRTGHFRCMAGVLRAERVWVETFTGLRLEQFERLLKAVP